MRLHIVQEGDTISSIADFYGVSEERIKIDNGNAVEGGLVPGQVLIITFPEKTYTVQDGDNLQKIANNNGITVLELLRNNPFLSDRQYIFPGETLVISYGDKIRSVTTNGYAREFIDKDVLRKTLPYLTYLSIFGYRILSGGNIEEIDDSELLLMAKAYGVVPIMIITSLSTLGQINVQNAYNILNNENQMDRLINNLVDVLKRKGYYGINISYDLLTNLTLPAYKIFNTKAYTRFKEAGLTYFITISPNIVFTVNELTFEKVDYSDIVQQCDGIIVLNYLWGFFLGPPAPISSISKINDFLEYLIPFTSPEKIIIGMPLIAYDWELPYAVGLSKASLLTLDAAITLAKEVNTVIQFDEDSQTPFYTYNTAISGIPIYHVVWSVNSISMNEILKMVTDMGLAGSGLWNIMRYIPQLWFLINTQYEIVKIPEELVVTD